MKLEMNQRGKEGKTIYLETINNCYVNEKIEDEINGEEWKWIFNLAESNQKQYYD